MLVVVTGFNHNPENNRITIGDTVKAFEIENATSHFTVGSDQDCLTLVTFWESCDAESRRACNFYNNLLCDSENIRFVGINMDPSEILFNEIVKTDGINPFNQYHISDGSTIYALRGAFGLESGMGSVLIDQQGKIIAFNPFL